MSMGRRLWRIARRGLRESLGGAAGAGGQQRDAAREELEEFLREPSGSPRPPDPEPRPQAPHPYTHEYRLLGAPVGSDLPTVQRCWRALVRETHPDRFAGDPAAAARAGDRLRRLNAAYERLRRYLESESSPAG